jgi:hypothetical protein
VRKLTLNSSAGALYLHPLALQMQLRPSLDYLTALDERSKEERRRERAGEGEDDSEDEKKEEVAKAVAVRLLHSSTVFERCFRPTQATFPAARRRGG